MRRKARGQALVESAFIALVLIVTLIAIFDLGQVLFLHQSFVERARNAARYGSVRTFDADAIRNMVLYNQSAAPDGSPPGFMGLTAGMVAVTREGAGTSDDRVVIMIANYPYRFFSPLIAGQFYGRPILVTAPMETP